METKQIRREVYGKSRGIVKRSEADKFIFVLQFIESQNKTE